MKNFKHDFIFNNKKYEMFYHPYNFTWENERCVEVPIVYQHLRESLNCASSELVKVLEVGNVFGIYTNYHHDIVDKYGNQSNIIKKDIFEYNPTSKYDFIFSISTLEHIGFDDYVSCDKLVDSVDYIKNLLAPGGKFVVTLPLGFQSVTKHLLDNSLKFDSFSFIKKTSIYNDWIQTNYDDAVTIQYGTPFPCANCICIAEYNKPF